jgi:hypothetical protein
MNKFNKLKQNSAENLKKLIDNINKISRFSPREKHKLRLETALRWTNNIDLLDTTLVSPSIHTRHSNQLKYKLIKKWNSIRKKHLFKFSQSIQIAEELSKSLKNSGKIKKTISDNEIASEHLRFFTLLDSVCLVDSFDAFSQTTLMRDELIEIVKKTKGISCLGAIEIEVIPINLLNIISRQENNKEKDFRKINVFNILAEQAGLKEYSSIIDASLFLIHFHGVIFAEKEEQFKNFEEQLKKNSRWNIANRQIELKKLSNNYGGNIKTVENNLKDIANYITKGANDLKQGSFKLKYKLNENYFYDRINEYEDGELEDSLSLTYFEISEQVKLLNCIMEIESNRTGYLINC